MTDGNDQDKDFIILDFCNQAIVFDTIAPLPASICGQTFAVQAGIAASFEIAANPASDLGGYVTIEFF